MIRNTVTLQEEPAESGYTSGSGDDQAGKKNDKPEESDSDSDDNAGVRRPGGGARDGGARDGGGFEVVPQQPPLRGNKRPMLSAEELALGEKMVYSKKSKRDMMDAGWNRWAATLKLLQKKFKKCKYILAEKHTDIHFFIS